MCSRDSCQSTGRYSRQPCVEPDHSCFTTCVYIHQQGDADRVQSASAYDISKVSPGAYAANPESLTPNTMRPAAYMERMNLDIDSLKKQYKRLRERQKQAHIILTAANAKHAENQARKNRARIEAAAIMPHIESPVAINHLFVGKKGMGMKNRKVAAAPRIVPAYPRGTPPSAHMRLAAQANAPIPMVHEKRNRTESTTSLSTIAASSTTDISSTEQEERDTFRDSESVASGELTPRGQVSPRGERKLSEGSEDSHYSLNASSAIIISENRSRSESKSREEGDEENKNSDSEGSEHQEVKEQEINLLLDFEQETNSKEEKDEVLPDSEQCCGVENTETKEKFADKGDSGEESEKQNVDANCTNPERDQVICQEPVSSSKKVEPSEVVEAMPPTLPPPPAELPVTVVGESSGERGLNATEEITAHYVAKLTYKTHKKNQEHLPPQQKNGDPVARKQTAAKSSHGQKVGQHSANQRTSTQSASSLHNNSRTFYPFPNRHVNSSRTENGIRLGLYSSPPEPQNGKQSRSKPGVKNISRAQINACLHRQYMAEIKQQAKAAK